MEIHKVNIDSLISPEFNPRTITDDDLQKLQDSIDNFGYIEPIYCQVIIDRWEEFTGETAIKIN